MGKYISKWMSGNGSVGLYPLLSFGLVPLGYFNTTTDPFHILITIYGSFTMRLSLTTLLIGVLSSTIVIASPLPATAGSVHPIPTLTEVHAPDVHVHGSHTIPLTTSSTPQAIEGGVKSEASPERLRMVKRFARQPSGEDIAKSNHVPETPTEKPRHEELDRRGLLSLLCVPCRAVSTAIHVGEGIAHMVHHK
ncbi:hypothetical protein FRC19_011635 [Serendipita sp. 401]|nr:hypothetical protein FRC19_011635 [Serendipita sp. 401]KAG9052383.1 hypothetical protein FS842_009945 [Serendipita sp. 407]